MKKHIKTRQINNTFICEESIKATSFLAYVISQALTDHTELCIFKVDVSIPEYISVINDETLFGFERHFQKTINNNIRYYDYECHTRFFWLISAGKYELTVILNSEIRSNSKEGCPYSFFIETLIEVSWAIALKLKVSDFYGWTKHSSLDISYVQKRDENR